MIAPIPLWLIAQLTIQPSQTAFGRLVAASFGIESAEIRYPLLPDLAAYEIKPSPAMVGDGFPVLSTVVICTPTIDPGAGGVFPRVTLGDNDIATPELLAALVFVEWFKADGVTAATVAECGESYVTISFLRNGPGALTP